MEKNIIVAQSDNHAIGRSNQLLWHISDDLKYFRKVTTGHAVIMGRKTFESIGRPLPKRQNIVISRTMSPVPGVQVARSLEEAFSLSEGDCFIIGGGEVYRQALPLVDRLYVTQVHLEVPDADTFFPEISGSTCKEESRSGMTEDPETGLSFEFVVYARI